MKILLFYLSFVVFFECYYNTGLCNKKLMQKFFLTGQKYSTYLPMKICGQVKDKCCTIVDEIKIQKYWKFRALPLLEAHNDFVLETVKQLMFLYDRISELDPKYMALKELKKAKIPYFHEFCLNEEQIFKKEDQLQFKTKLEQFKFERLAWILRKDPTQTKLIKEFVDQKISTTKKIAEFEEHELNLRRQFDNIYKNRQTFQKDDYKFTLTPTFTHNILKCQSKKIIYEKDLLILGSSKAKVCNGLYNKMVEFDNKRFMQYLQELKIYQQNIVRYRSNFYCSICDIHQQKYFAITKQEMVLSTGFCQSLIHQSLPSFKFFNIIFVEYLDVMIQMTGCYDSSSSNQTKTISFLDKYKKRIPLIQKCLGSLESPEFMKDCWFICNSFHWNKVSPLFEGLDDLYKSIKFVLTSFERRMHEERLQQKQYLKIKKKSKKKDILGTLNGLLLEPINPSLIINPNNIIIDKETKKQILGNFESMRPIGPVLLKRLESYLLKEMKPSEIDEIKDLLEDRKQQIKKYIKRYNFLKKYREIFKSKKKGLDHLPQKLKKKLIRDDKDAGEEMEQLKVDMNITDKHEKKQEERQLKQIKNNFLYFLAKKILKKQRNLIQTSDIIKNIQNQILEKIQANDPKFKYEQQQNIYQTDERNLGVVKAKEIVQKPKEEPIPQIARVENGVEIYQKVISMFDIKQLKQKFRRQGINLTINANMVNYLEKTEQLISSYFKKEDHVYISSVQQYLTVTNKNINDFNHVIDSYIQIHQEIKKDSQKYVDKKKIFEQETNLKKKIAAKNEMKKVHRKGEAHRKRKEEKIFLKKLKEQQKQNKLKSFQKSTKVTNHIEKKNFKENFYGITSLFTKLFGT